MPLYGSAVYPAVDTLTTGKPSPVWGSKDANGNLTVGEAVTVGTMSQQVAMPNNEYTPRSYAVELAFVDVNGNPAAPGTFEVDVMHATTDAASHYCKVGTITAVNANNVARLEMVNVVTKFVALNLTALANAVRCIATITK